MSILIGEFSHGWNEKFAVEEILGKARASVQPSVTRETCLPDMVDTHPFLRQFLVGWEEGKQEMPGGFLGIFVNEDGPKAMLTHQQESMKAFVTALEMQELFQSLEEGLELEKLTWRQEKEKSKRGRR